MGAEDRETAELLRRWHDGDGEALEQLIQRDLPWIREHVKKRLGPLLRGKAETQDYVQDALVEFLRYGPRFLTEDRDRMRGLLARIIENVLRDRNDWFRAKRRAVSKERRMGSTMVLDLDRRAPTVARPSQEAIREEQEAWTRLALELLEPEDRDIITMRHWEGLSFAEIGERLGVGTDAARMRLNRALPKLAKRLVELRGSAASGARPDASA